MSTVSRADLLKVLMQTEDAEALAAQAKLFGYQVREQHRAYVVAIPPLTTATALEATPSPQETLPQPTPETKTTFPYLAFSHLKQKPPKALEGTLKRLAWFRSNTEPEAPLPPRLKDTGPKTSRSLYNTQKLKERLMSCLRREKPSYKIDIPKTITKIARAEFMHTLPCQNRTNSTPLVQLISDVSDVQLQPIHRDIQQATKDVTAWVGEPYLKTLTLTPSPQREKYQRTPANTAYADLHSLLIDHYTTNVLKGLIGVQVVVVISDLGLYHQDDKVLNQWLHFASIARAYSCELIALLPVPPRYLSAKVTAAFECICLEHPDKPLSAVHTPRTQQCTYDLEQTKHTLLSALATSSYIDRHLLRATRDLFYGEQILDIAHEVLAWQHPEVLSEASHICVKAAHRQAYYAELTRLPSNLKEAVRNVLITHHGQCKHTLEDFWIAIGPFDALCGISDEITAFSDAAARQVAWRFEKLSKGEATRTVFVRQLQQGFASRQHQQDYSAVMASVLRKKDPAFQAHPQTDTEIMQALLNESPVTTRTYQLLHRQNILILTEKQPPPPKRLKMKERVLIEFTSRAKELSLTYGSSNHWLKTNQDLPHTLSITPEDATHLTIDTPEQTLTLSDIRPKWATATGRDQYGYYAELEVKGVVQRFRWIEPGEFWMGSPEDEPERFSREKRHRVRLTEGFWLGDTACTQALWEAVMGDNPSRFKGENRPVEKVSWNDTQKFIGKLNGVAEGIEVRLPTEAEWEYSCRAGMETPFWFGDAIHSE